MKKSKKKKFLGLRRQTAKSVSPKHSFSIRDNECYFLFFFFTFSSMTLTKGKKRNPESETTIGKRRGVNEKKKKKVHKNKKLPSVKGFLSLRTAFVLRLVWVVFSLSDAQIYIKFAAKKSCVTKMYYKKKTRLTNKRGHLGS